MTMKPTLQDVAMMEVIAVETAPIQTVVLNVHVMMKEHCHLMYHVSYGSIFGIHILENTNLHKIFVYINLEILNFGCTLMFNSG